MLLKPSTAPATEVIARSSTTVSQTTHFPSCFRTSYRILPLHSVQICFVAAMHGSHLRVLENHDTLKLTHYRRLWMALLPLEDHAAPDKEFYETARIGPSSAPANLAVLYSRARTPYAYLS